MKTSIFSAVIALQLLVTEAIAGAWLREKGTSFSSFSLSTSLFRETRSSGYLEFGLTENSTLGLDTGLSQNANGEKLAYGTLFMRRALGSGAGPNQWAYEVGLGATYRGGVDAQPHVKTGLSWGRGIQFRGKGGWIAADAAALWAISDDEHVSKIDTTLGLNFNNRFSGILQLNFAYQEGETFKYFEPSIVFNPPNTGLKIQFGLITPLDEPENSGVKLGLWREF
ncbi:MAG: hypothetical protein HKN30_12445 [Sulfitobacter sp.]|nr:hypothetical protein [Sulfitobacter sp.]